MKLKVFSIYDSKMEAYMQPFFMQARGAAIRAFADTASDPNTSFNKHPSDYTLFEIGEYDDQSGRIDMHPALVPLGTALDLQSLTKKGLQPQLVQ